MEPSVPLPMLELVSVPPPDSTLCEDAWLAMQAGTFSDQLYFAAIDGATTRLTPPPLQRYLASLPGDLTPAAFSARLLRASLVREISAGPPDDLRVLALKANTDLGRVLTGLFGELELDKLGFPPEVRATLDDDPRLVRVGLPASVLTLAHYNPATHELSYVHAGDTALVVVHQDGRVDVPTAPENARTGSELKRIADDLRDQYPDRTFRELTEMPTARRQDVNGALYHNYVDVHGLPQPSQGSGAFNGQRELRYFLHNGQVALDGVAWVGVFSDGAIWPASAREICTDDDEEAAALREQRLVFMASMIEEIGLNGYLRELRQAQQEDSDHERYPRIKTFDDATAVLLRMD